MPSDDQQVTQLVPIHTPQPAFAGWSGSRKPQMLLVGEAWGQSEMECGQPFAGASGKLLWEMLGEALPDVWPDEHQRITSIHRYGLSWVREREPWLEEAGIAFTNVVAFRPPDNNFDALCASKAAVGSDYRLPPISQGKYLKPEYLSELARLWYEIHETRPNILVPLGNKAAWGVLASTAISTIRGAVGRAVPYAAWPADTPAPKALATYHPAAILRQWSWRAITVADLMKARTESRFPEIRRPQRWVLVDPSLDEIAHWLTETRCQVNSGRCRRLAWDVETRGGLISCISFARSETEALVIPFLDTGREGWSYWPTHAEECVAWDHVEQLLTLPVAQLGQNLLYDIQYALKSGIRPNLRSMEDTMLLHHSLYPELQKGLGFLGSVYTSEASWKLMRRRRPDTEKRDE